MDFSFFTTENKSGYKTKEKWFSKNYPEVYSQIDGYSNKMGLSFSFKEKIWFYFNKLTVRPSCKTCGSELKFRERFDIPYGEFCCLDCINNNKDEMISRQMVTFNKKYGVNFYPEHKDFITKQRKTKLLRYNDENFNNFEKSKETKLLRYNDENFNNTDKYKITCINKYDVNNYSKSNSYQNKITQKFISLYPNIKFTYVGKLIVKVKCEDCGRESELTKQLLYERYKRNYVVCTHCNPIGQATVSGIEKEISGFLCEINIPYKQSDHSILGKREIDIFIPPNNTAFEIDGVYWHNELFVTSDYHLQKTIDCQDKGVDLIHIFDDEWKYKQEIVKSIIKNRLKITDNTIYARKCLIKEIDSKTIKFFLDNNHIQGNVNSKVRLGLYYNDELVSVMSFSKGRVIMGGKKDEWELNRFANKINTNVVGAAGKLFKYFTRNYNPTKIISYSDIRIFKGGMYENLGFTKKSQSKPNYWYVINGIRYYRFNFRKSVLVKQGYDKNKTEKEIMFERKIYRIYDCGNVRWEYNL